MPPQEQFVALRERLDVASESAATELFERYAERLVRLAEEQLASGVRPKLDGDDVVQSALRSFFRRQRQRDVELISWDSLWGLLVRITLRKCGKQETFFQAAKRDARLDVTYSSATESSSQQIWQAQKPTANDAAVLQEIFAHVRRECTDLQQTIFFLHLEGYRGLEIAERVERSIRTVRRTLAEIRRGLRKFVE